MPFFPINFNSIKVRLERDLQHACLTFVKDFNSIKVRLELAPAGVVYTYLGFQFHKGTIRTFWS